MKTIVINPKDFNAPEVSANVIEDEHLIHFHSVDEYDDFVARERAVTQRLVQMSIMKELPKIVALLPAIHEGFKPEEIQQRISETLGVIKKVAHLMLDGFHIRIVRNILEISTGHGSVFGDEFQHRFDPLFNDKDCREGFWETRWELPCFIAEGLLDDLMGGINIEAPTAEDLQKSKVIRVARTFECPEETINSFIATYEGA